MTAWHTIVACMVIHSSPYITIANESDQLRTFSQGNTATLGDLQRCQHSGTLEHQKKITVPYHNE